MTRLELTIELDHLDVDSANVRGTVRQVDGAEAPFVGWISLMALLQAAVVSSAASGATR